MPVCRWHVLLLLVCGSACLTFAVPDSSRIAPVQRGTITFVDTERKLLVLQNNTNATAVQVENFDPTLRVGDEIELKGELAPFVPSMPDFPNRPAKADILKSFEAPANLGNTTLSRLRGVLHPPTTGDYTFWIASDDSSELWLSDNELPAGARKIAQVETGRFTDARQWTRFSSQQSDKIHLEAGKSYYIEALEQNTSGRDCLAVAWQPPGAPQAVIDRAFVSPCLLPEMDVAAVRQGVSWELWTNFFSRDLAVLRRPDDHILKCSSVQILAKQKGELPEALSFPFGEELDSKATFRLIEVEGRVDFISRLEDGWRIELKSGNSRIVARLKSAADFPAVIPAGSLVRARGVFEPLHGFHDNAVAGTVWVNTSEGLSWVDTEENWAAIPPLLSQQLTPTHLDLTAGKIIHAQGRVMAEETNGLWRLEGKDSFQGFLSADGTNWMPIGPPVEIDMSNVVTAGFAISSYRTDDVATVKFDHISGLTTDLLGANIGDVPREGSFEAQPGALVLRGAGDHIWAGADQCYFAYQRAKGDFEIVARLTELKTADPLAKAMLMVRQSIASNSPWAGVALAPGDRIGLQSRWKTGTSAAGPLALQSEKWIKLVRRRNTFFVRAQTDLLQPGQSADVLGKVEWQNQMLVLDKPRLRIVPDSETMSNASPLIQADAGVQDVRAGELRVEAERAQRVPHSVTIRVRGVVTFNGPAAGEWITYVQDDSGAARIQWKSASLRNGCREGDWVELTGAPVLAGGVPIIMANGVTRLGDGEMPEPKTFAADKPQPSGSDGQWSEVDGVVHSVAKDGALLMMTRTGAFEVKSSSPDSPRLNLVDAHIRARGIFLESPKRTLYLPSERYLEILESPPNDPFDIPLVSIGALGMIENNSHASRRVKIAGVITCCRDNFLTVQEKSGGIRVEMKSPPNLKVGDAAEVVGFLSENKFGLVLSEALVRPHGQREPLLPIQLSSEDLIHSETGSLLATVEAVLLEQRAGRGVQTLDVQAGQRVFQASLPETLGQLPSITPGSRIHLAGVTMVQHAEASSAGAAPLAGSFEILLRNPGDVAVIESPPWWNWKHTAAVFGLAIAILIAAMLWIRTLRQRVEERTRELRDTMGKLEKETRTSATLAERDRLAGEIHDSVEQGLSAIVMQMEAAAKLVDQPDEIRRYLSMAKNMAGFSRTEVQHAVWHLQSPLLQNADLATALQRVAQEISAGDMPRVTVDVSGAAFGLSSAVEHHLLRMAQEAITNAVKHGNPKTISLTLQYQPDAVVLTVRDDGSGFVPETVSHEGGHFGLQGMRGRARKIEAELAITSNPGKGTCIQIVVPCDERVASGVNAKENGH
jgi:signal transduction histidine kinase